MSTDAKLTTRRPANNWSAADAAVLREIADQYPLEFAESPVLAMLVEAEGLRLRDTASTAAIAA